MDGLGALFARFSVFRFSSNVRFANEYAQESQLPQPYAVEVDDLGYSVTLDELGYGVTLEDLGMRPQVHRSPRGGRMRERW